MQNFFRNSICFIHSLFSKSFFDHSAQQTTESLQCTSLFENKRRKTSRKYSLFFFSFQNKKNVVSRRLFLGGRTIHNHKVLKASVSWLRIRKYAQAFYKPRQNVLVPSLPCPKRKKNQIVNRSKVLLNDMLLLQIATYYILDCNFDLVRFTFLEKTSILHMNTLLQWMKVCTTPAFLCHLCSKVERKLRYP